MPVSKASRALRAVGGCGIAFLSILSTSVAAQPSGCPLHSPPLVNAPETVVYQQFPATGELETAWRVTYGHAPARALFLTSAYFKPGSGEPWIRVLGLAGLSDIFVPYARGHPRFYDLSQFNFDLIEVNRRDAGLCGKLLGTPPKVVKEVRDSGILWKNDERVHRGRELVLWGAVDAANYNYLISYHFRDDGTIQFRIAATGANLPSHEWVAHTHNALWRIDIDLGGEDGDTAYISRYLQSRDHVAARNTLILFNGGKEGFADWNAREFTTVRIVDDTLVNEHGRRTGYDFQPLRRGIARHFEDFTAHDFWVTRKKINELSYEEIAQYVADGESIENTDLVVWHMSPILHVPRGEDGKCLGVEDDIGCKIGQWVGSALAMWGGFDLRPRNLFSRTPFYAPSHMR
jgi:primary-amine oxidase